MRGYKLPANYYDGAQKQLDLYAAGADTHKHETARWVWIISQALWLLLVSLPYLFVLFVLVVIANVLLGLGL